MPSYGSSICCIGPRPRANTADLGPVTGPIRNYLINNIILSVGYPIYSSNVLSFIISVVSGVAYWIFGYAFAFGKGNDFIGYNHFAIHDLPETEFAGFFFQYTFAATAATIVSGAVAERCEFLAYFVYSFCITGKYFSLQERICTVLRLCREV